MSEITKKDWLIRIVIGGLGGVLFQSAFSTLLFSAFMGSFHFCFFTRFGYPAVLSPAGELAFDLCCTALMFAFGAEIGVATLPFDDDGKRLLWKSILHFAVMAATVTAWTLLNFAPADIPYFLRPLCVIYAFVWAIRWLRWRLELNAIKKKLGLLGKESGANAGK